MIALGVDGSRRILSRSEPACVVFRVPVAGKAGSRKDAKTKTRRFGVAVVASLLRQAWCVLSLVLRYHR